MLRRTIAEEFARGIRRKNPQIEKVVLFGSVARGEDSGDSDIDLLVVAKADRRKVRDSVMDDVVKTLLEKKVYVSAKVLSGREYKALKNTHFVSEIDEKGVVLG